MKFFIRYTVLGLCVIVFGCGGEVSGPAPAPELPAPAGVVLGRDSVWIVSGDTLVLEALVWDTTGKAIEIQTTWSELNPGVASVSRSGVVTAHSPGYTPIHVSVAQFADTAHAWVVPRPATQDIPVLGNTIYTGERCGWRPPAEERLIVDILFASSGPANSSHVEWVNRHGGFAFYRYNLAIVRASVPRDSIPVIVDQKRAFSARTVPNPERYDVGLLLLYDRPVTAQDQAGLEALGAVIHFRYVAALQGFALTIADPFVPMLRSLEGVRSVSLDRVFCAG